MSGDVRPPHNRRSFLATTALTAGAFTVPAVLAPPTASAARSRALSADPFTLGVASGDPDHDGFVLWTRLAVRPLAGDGRGGMPSRDIPVRWEVATDPRFRAVVRRGTAAARPKSAHSVHVVLDGLEPGRDYWYRFRVERYISPAGRTRTAPRPDVFGPALAMAFASCSQFEHGYFTAYRRLAEEHPDLILHLGDYLYEYTKDTYRAPGGNLRDHVGGETMTLADYRRRHAQYKRDRDLQAAHAAAPWIIVWDDHELDNNWADEVHEKPERPQPDFLRRRAAAFRAYYENMPLRRTSVPKGIDMQLYRRIRWGRLATFHMLDTRQYRSDQACGDGRKSCAGAADAKRSITGAQQEKWLIDGFRNSTARWDLIGQQVMFAQYDMASGPLKVTNMDAWDGYVASRRRITRGWMEAGVRNPVVLTGDTHAHFAANLKADYDDPSSRTVGAELVSSSISSDGDGADVDPARDPLMKINPHLRFYNTQRGYVLARITQTELKADFKVVPYVRKPGAPVRTRATFVVQDRVPGVHRTYLRPVDRPVPGDPPGRTIQAETIRS